MTRRLIAPLGLLLACCAAGVAQRPVAAASRPESRADAIELIGKASVAGDACDLSGLPGKLEDATPCDRLGGNGSAIAWSGSGTRYVMVSDRGPGDGANSYATRFHELDLVVEPGATPALKVTLTKTTLFRTESGQGLVGRASALGGDGLVETRFDPEGVRYASPGSLLVSDEYGPSISEFGLDGVRRRQLPVPAAYLPRTRYADPKQELAANKKGRVPNKGFEGLALTPSGRTLYALPQAALIQDHGRDGCNCRLLEIDLASGATRQLVVALTEPTNEFSEVLATSEDTLLAIERDSQSGAAAREKKIVRLDVGSGSERAADVSSIESLPARKTPPGVKPVRKSPFLDLLDPRFKLAGREFPPKIEGLAFGPDLPDGRRLLLVTSDNDVIAAAPTWIWAFAIPRRLLESE